MINTYTRTRFSDDGARTLRIRLYFKYSTLTYLELDINIVGEKDKIRRRQKLQIPTHWNRNAWKHFEPTRSIAHLRLNAFVGTRVSRACFILTMQYHRFTSTIHFIPAHARGTHDWHPRFKPVCSPGESEFRVCQSSWTPITGTFLVIGVPLICNR